MRRQLVGKLRRKLDGGALTLLGSINGALVAIDAEMLLEADLVDRAVVADSGRSIQLAVCAGADKVVAVELSPARAVALAGELIRAALLRLGQ